ncbi:Gx transporter family protein [Clostridium tetani]|nr:Gx transporter family protein [Clostridium tetani]QBD87003.1 Gx transporter family protein [Clostridium tetani]
MRGDVLKNIKKLVFISLLVSIALIIYIVEAQLPLLLPGIPGIKLGLSNSISLFALLTLGGKEALLIMFLRTILGSFLGGSMSSFFYSVAGGLFSNIIMIFLYNKFKDKLSLWSISIIGALFHNIGQLLVASIIIQDLRIYMYLPILMLSGIITGYFIGILTNLLYKHTSKVALVKNLKNLK